MKTVTILIADDHEVVRHGLISLLEVQHEWKVLEASHGNEAVMKATQFRPDLVILSMTTPAVSSPSRSAEMHPAGNAFQRAAQTPSPSPFIRKPLPLGLLLGLLLLLLFCFMTSSSQVAKSLAVVPPTI